MSSCEHDWYRSADPDKWLCRHCTHTAHLPGFPYPKQNGLYEQALSDWVECRNIERTEALTERYGPIMTMMMERRALRGKQRPR